MIFTPRHYDENGNLRTEMFQELKMEEYNELDRGKTVSQIPDDYVFPTESTSDRMISSSLVYQFISHKLKTQELRHKEELKAASANGFVSGFRAGVRRTLEEWDLEPVFYDHDGEYDDCMAALTEFEKKQDGI